MIERTARTMLKSVREMVPGHFRTRPATPLTHPRLQWDAYEEAAKQLRENGFRSLGDLEPVSYPVSPSLSHPNAMRFFLSQDGTVVVAFYKMALRWTPFGILGRLLGGAKPNYDFITEFSDGSVVETTTAQLAGMWSQPPFAYREFVPASAGVAGMLARHRQAVAASAAGRAEASVVRFTSLQDVLTASDAHERRKREWRRSVGWATREELARASRLAGPQLDQLEATFRRLAAEADRGG